MVDSKFGICIDPYLKSAAGATNVFNDNAKPGFFWNSICCIAPGCRTIIIDL